ncbi:MAG: IS110 family transposase [Acetobacteraceae bacterium]|nr:IS110 family transposase [Acetobacteraceae bacterium]
MQNNGSCTNRAAAGPVEAPVRVQVGIDAAVTAHHHVSVRTVDVTGREHTERFMAAPTLSGLAALTGRLAPYRGVVAVAEPTSMTWLSLSVAVAQAGGQFTLLGSRHAARLRGAIAGKNKSDVIDADVLARAGEVFTLRPMPVLTPAQLALRRAVTRRGAAVIEGNRSWRRLMSLARWAFPDVWTAFGGSLPTAIAVLDRWPHLAQLGSARRASVTAVVAEHTRAVGDVPARVEQIRAAATAWARFWDGRLDLDALAWDVSEHLTDYHQALQRVDRATRQANAYWQQLFGDDPLLHSVPGIGPATGPTMRAFLGDGSMFDTGKQAACYAGIVPSNWSSGTVTQPSRAITKEGPAVLRLACYQAANAARQTDPQLAALYYRLMTERGHCHTQANVAVARKLVERVWTVIARGQPYQLRDPAGQPITARAAKALITERFTVPAQTRTRARAHSAATHRAKLTR